MSNDRTEIIAYIEECVFVDDKGQKVPYLRLGIPLSDSVIEYVKVKKTTLELARDYAERNN